MIVPMSELKDYLYQSAINKNRNCSDKCLTTDKHDRVQHFRDKSIKQLMNTLIDSNRSFARNKTTIKNANLTQREQQILILIMAGLSNKLIGRELNICESTVKVHVKNLMRKLKVYNRYEAALISIADVLETCGKN